MEYYHYSRLFGAYGTIYTLADKQGNVFYIGCTVMGLEKRLSSHISSARGNSEYENNKRRELIRSLNYEIVATAIDIKWITGTDAKSAMRRLDTLEKTWIQKYLSLGYKLCNAQTGGKRKLLDKVGDSYSSKVTTLQLNKR